MNMTSAETSKIIDLCISYSRGRDTTERLDRLNFIRSCVLKGITEVNIISVLISNYPLHQLVDLGCLPEDDDFAYAKLYANAVQSAYAMKVLEAFANTKREYLTMLTVLREVTNITTIKNFDFMKYIKDSAYSDEWVVCLAERLDKIDELIDCKYPMIDLFTADHSPKAFALLVDRLYFTDCTRVNVDWFKDPMWREEQTDIMFKLHVENKDVDYISFVSPRTPVPVLLEMWETNANTKQAYDELMNKWRFMSPKLEWVMHCTDKLETIDDWETYYRIHESQYDCQGDAVADAMIAEYNLTVPVRVARYQCYFHQIQVPEGAVEWLRANLSDSFNAISDKDLWEVGADMYYKNYPKDVEGVTT